MRFFVIYPFGKSNESNRKRKRKVKGETFREYQKYRDM